MVNSSSGVEEDGGKALGLLQKVVVTVVLVHDTILYFGVHGAIRAGCPPDLPSPLTFMYQTKKELSDRRDGTPVKPLRSQNAVCP